MILMATPSEQAEALRQGHLVTQEGIYREGTTLWELLWDLRHPDSPNVAAAESALSGGFGVVSSGPGTSAYRQVPYSPKRVEIPAGFVWAYPLDEKPSTISEAALRDRTTLQRLNLVKT